MSFFAAKLVKQGGYSPHFTAKNPCENPCEATFSASSITTSARSYTEFDRRAVVSLRNQGIEQEQLIVHQSGTPIIKVEETEFNAPSEGMTRVLGITTNQSAKKRNKQPFQSK